MNWPDTIELVLDGIAQGGEGVGRWEGRVVFVNGGLPGERVRVHLTERHDNYARGMASEVLLPSPDRVVPRLPGADHVDWQHIAYGAQLRFKRQILADQLAKIGGLDQVAVAETLPSPLQWGYRNSARFHVEGTRIGYHVAGTRTLHPIAEDPLLQPALNEALATLRPALHGDDRVQEVVLRVSEAHGYTVAELRGTGNLRGLAQRWRRQYPNLAGVVLPTPPHVGTDHLTEELQDTVFLVRPSTFFQVNRAAALTLLQLVRDGLALHGTERLLDLYCGVGVFTLPLAASAREVVGVEEHPAAVADARTSAAENSITNARFLAGRVEMVLRGIEGAFDAILLDPPRRGCHPEALREMLKLAPQRIVYVSCHPATLARDLKLLVAGGYRVVHVQPVDLFPQTAHIESVTVLHREAS